MKKERRKIKRRSGRNVKRRKEGKDCYCYITCYIIVKFFIGSIKEGIEMTVVDRLDPNCEFFNVSQDFLKIFTKLVEIMFFGNFTHSVCCYIVDTRSIDHLRTLNRFCTEFLFFVFCSHIAPLR